MKKSRARHPGRRYTTADLKFVIAQAPHMSIRDMAKAMGRTEGGLRSFACRHDIPLAGGRYRHWTNHEDKYLRDNAGKIRPAVMAKKINRTEKSVRQYAQDNNFCIAMSDYVPWSDDDVRRVRYLVSIGAPVRDYQDAFEGHRPSTVKTMFAKQKAFLIREDLMPEGFL